jgi:hypothetical protein
MPKQKQSSTGKKFAAERTMNPPQGASRQGKDGSRKSS